MRRTNRLLLTVKEKFQEAKHELGLMIGTSSALQRERELIAKNILASDLAAKEKREENFIRKLATGEANIVSVPHATELNAHHRLMAKVAKYKRDHSLG